MGRGRPGESLKIGGRRPRGPPVEAPRLEGPIAGEQRSLLPDIRIRLINKAIE